MKGFKMTLHKLMQLGVASIAMLALVGCQTLSAPTGRQLSPEALLALSEAQMYPNSWSTRDLRVDYRLTLRGNTVDFAGAVFFENPIKYNFVTIECFHLAVIFADDAGKILDMRGLTSSAHSDPEVPHAFNGSFPVSPAAHYYAFSYNVRALEGGAVDGGSWSDFFYYPVR